MTHFSYWRIKNTNSWIIRTRKKSWWRALDESRELKIETNAIPKANGSAIFFGDTEVICVKFNQTDHSQIWRQRFVHVYCWTFTTFTPNCWNWSLDLVIELARVVDRGIRESHMIDVSQLVIEKDKSVVGVFADNVVVDYDGNLFDACSYAATAALLNSKTPTWEMVDEKPTLVEGQEKQLPINTIPYL